MIVVADTSPINYLVLIKVVDILPRMYGVVVIPRAVQEELLRSTAPEIVQAWIRAAPAWLEIRTPVNAPDSSLAKLDPGERDAIMLATELHADRLIVDDREGRTTSFHVAPEVLGSLLDD
jgi:predicted nucleic acid-binding protein